MSLASGGSGDQDSPGVLLLRDIRTVIGDREKIWSHDVLLGLLSLEEAPWGDVRGKPPWTLPGLRRVAQVRHQDQEPPYRRPRWRGASRATCSTTPGRGICPPRRRPMTPRSAGRRHHGPEVRCSGVASHPAEAAEALLAEGGAPEQVRSIAAPTPASLASSPPRARIPAGRLDRLGVRGGPAGIASRTCPSGREGSLSARRRSEGWIHGPSAEGNCDTRAEPWVAGRRWNAPGPTPRGRPSDAEQD